MPTGVRELTVLGEFKPFGLVAEALDGKPTDDDLPDDYHYFLFDPNVTKQRDDAENLDDSSPISDRSDHELFVRGNRIIWSIGSRVYKRFTLPSPVIKACWCRMGDMTEGLLCVLQIDTLTIYNTSGEVTSIPLPRNIVSIWPLPDGLLLQQVPEGNTPENNPFLPSSAFFSRDILRPKRDSGYSPQHNYSPPTHGFDHSNKGNGVSLSSHLILKDPLEEPEPLYIEERGRLNVMKEFDERTIWTSEHVPVMASYSKGKVQHSLWVAESINSSLKISNFKTHDTVPAGVLTKQFSFRRIWQGKVSQRAAAKVLT